MRESLLQSALDALSARITILDEGGRILAANAAWLQASEAGGVLAHGHAVGTDYLALCDRAAAEGQNGAHALAVGIRDVLAGRAREYVLEYADNQTGEMRWYAAKVTRFADTTRLVLVHDDITRRKQAEYALIRMTREVATERDRARRATRAKSSFLAAMSHEIRTPMNGVIGVTNLLADTPLSEEQQDLVETLRVSGEALLTIISDVLDFSKIEAGRLDLEDRDFDVRGAIEDVADLMAARAEEKGLRLVTFVDARLPTRVRGDAGRLRQVVTNLVGNAVKFTASGCVQIRCRLASADDDAVALHVEVHDTGIGIAPETVPHLFQAFRQADESTTRRFGGTGLGLAISKQLVERMGGEIGVRSEPGRGSCFGFTVRLKPATEPVAPTEPLAQPSAPVLCVVPDRVERLALRHALRCNAVRTTVRARDGSSAAIAFVDVRAGRERVREIVRGSGHVVLLGALTDRADARRLADELGCTLIAKPVRAAHVVRALQAAAGTRAEDVRQAPKRPAPHGGRPLRVLVAEDNRVNQIVAQRMLERLGCVVTIVENGNEALLAATVDTFDVIFMDVQMPELDGLGATRAIRALDGPPARVPIVAMTANAMASDRDACLDAGMDDYVSKPVRPEALEQVLDTWARSAVEGDGDVASQSRRSA